MMLVTEDSEMVRRRGRWLSNKIMEIYVQEVSAIQFLHQLPDTTRRLVLTGTHLFPKILQQLLHWHASGTLDLHGNICWFEERTWMQYMGVKIG